MKLAEQITKQIEEDELAMCVPFTEEEKKFWSYEITQFFLENPKGYSFVVNSRKLERRKMFKVDGSVRYVAKERNADFSQWAKNEGFIVSYYKDFGEIVIKLPKNEEED